MGKMQYLEHINITSGQEDRERKKEKGNKMWIHHLKGDVIKVTITLTDLAIGSSYKLGWCVINTSHNILLEYQNWKIPSVVTNLILQ
jgi:hypothetical protein